MTVTDYRLTAATVQRLLHCLPSTTPIRTSCCTLRQGAQLHFTSKVSGTAEGSANIRLHPVNHLIASYSKLMPSLKASAACRTFTAIVTDLSRIMWLAPSFRLLNNGIRPRHTEPVDPISTTCKHAQTSFYTILAHHDLNCRVALGLRNRERMSN